MRASLSSEMRVRESFPRSTDSATRRLHCVALCGHDIVEGVPALVGVCSRCLSGIELPPGLDTNELLAGEVTIYANDETSFPGTRVSGQQFLCAGCGESVPAIAVRPDVPKSLRRKRAREAADERAAARARAWERLLSRVPKLPRHVEFAIYFAIGGGFWAVVIGLIHLWS